MISGGGNLDAAGVLAAARAAKTEENAAAARVLKAAVDWAHLHHVTDVEDAATWWSGSRTMGQDTGIPIAGEGCPLVSEFAVAEFATAVGMSQETGRHYLGQALEEVSDLLCKRSVRPRGSRWTLWQRRTRLLMA